MGTKTVSGLRCGKTEAQRKASSGPFAAWAGGVWAVAEAERSEKQDATRTVQAKRRDLERKQARQMKRG